jgi:hypothetical protein
MTTYVPIEFVSQIRRPGAVDRNAGLGLRLIDRQPPAAIAAPELTVNLEVMEISAPEGAGQRGARSAIHRGTGWHGPARF